LLTCDQSRISALIRPHDVGATGTAHFGTDFEPFRDSGCRFSGGFLVAGLILNPHARPHVIAARPPSGGADMAWLRRIICSALMIIGFLQASSNTVLAQTCPVNEVSMGTPLNRQYFYPVGPTFDHVYGDAQARYDMSQGTIRCWAYNANSTVTLTDLFAVTGLPAGTPLTFQASIHLTGGLGAACDLYAGAWLTIREGTSNTRSFSRFIDGCVTGGVALDTILTLTINRVAGETFPIYIQLGCGQDTHGGTSLAATALVFTGLPPGARITSCQGFSAEVPVAVSPSTWSSVKALAD
jgi:hypothetical protein